MYYGLIGPQAQGLGAPTVITTFLPLAPTLLSVIIAIPIGAYADKTGRRKEWLLVGLVFALVFNVLLAYVTGWQELTIFRIIGAGVYSAVLYLYIALFIFNLPPQRRGLGIGLFLGIATVGSFVFNIVAGSVVQSYGFPTMYLMAAVVTAITLVTVAPVTVPRYKIPPIPGALRKALSHRGVWVPGFGILLTTFGTTAVIVSLSVTLATHGTSLATIGLIFAINAVASAVGMILGGTLTDKIGPRTVMVIMGIISGIFALIASFVGLTWYVVSPFVWIMMFFWGQLNSAMPASASASVSRELQGTAANSASVFAGLGGLIGSIIGGILLGLSGFGTTTLIMGIVIIMGAIVAIGTPKLVKKAGEQVHH
jgi:MFS family permease